jgi:hypothetical protein
VSFDPKFPILRGLSQKLFRNPLAALPLWRSGQSKLRIPPSVTLPKSMLLHNRQNILPAETN